MDVQGTSVVQEPTEPGFYRYSGGMQNMIFLRDRNGAWWTWFDNTMMERCVWGYIEQALSVWDLVKIEGEMEGIAGTPVEGSLQIKQEFLEGSVSLPNLDLKDMTLAGAVYTTVGAASVCWDPMEGTGVFMDDQARNVAEQLMDYLGEKLILDLINFQKWRDNWADDPNGTATFEDIAKQFLESRSG